MSETYVEDKKSTLRKEFYDKLNDYMGGESRLMFSDEFGNSSYKPIDMDAVRFIDNRDANDYEYYGSVERLFPYDRYPFLTSTMFKCLKPGCFGQLYELNAVIDIPWQAYLLKRNDKDEFQLFKFTPVAVGYLQSSANMKEWRPSLDKSCDEALEYITKEDKDYRTCYNQNYKKTVQNILNLYNDYYYLQKNEQNTIIGEFDNSINFEQIKLPPNPESDPLSGHNVNWIYNGFYRVYYDIYTICNFEVSFNDYNYKNDKDAFFAKYIFVIRFCSILVASILLACLLNFLYRNRKTDNEGNKTGPEIKAAIEDNEEDISKLYIEIIEKSNPKHFIEPYQPVKLNIANDIYSKAIENKNNRVVLKELKERIIKEL